MSGVGVAKVAQILDLCNFIPQMELKGHRIMIRDVNRPALQLSGYFEHFEQSRVQIIGTVDYTYLQQLDEKKKEAIYREFMAYDIPCVIFCRDLKPDEMFLKIAEESNLPVFGTKRSTSEFMAELIYCLSEQLAPCITIHGVLVDVYGEGLLIMGESGIGKSEAALELVRRGHRLVTDDVVEIRKINEHTLIGTSPDITRYFIELRGIGIIDVKTLFGVEGVKEKQQIDLVIQLGQLLAQGSLRCIAVDLSYRCACRNTFAVCHQISQRAAARNVAFLKQEHSFGIHGVLHRSQQGGLVGIGRKQHLHCLIAHIQCRQQQKHDNDSGQRFQCAGDALAVFFLHIAHPFAKNSFVRRAACSRTSGAEASSQQMPSMWRNQVSWRLA